ncbi:MAG: hypothetical protein HKN25_05085 [Pyrinomonadaceae bacterium]|nr:hypothetical protein [Pyrinomonadaceae bacterium]
MEGVEDFVKNGGIPLEFQNSSQKTDSPRRRGVKQGGLMIFGGFILVPLLAILSEGIGLPEELVAFAAVFLFWGGFLRILYALIFQRRSSVSEADRGFIASVKKILLDRSEPSALPPQQSGPTSTIHEPPIGKWRETSDLDPAAKSKR